MNAGSRTQTAAQAYTESRNEIARLIDVLQMELDKHAARAKAEPQSWGAVGTLQTVRSDLINLVGCLSGMERSDIEDFLNDAE